MKINCRALRIAIIISTIYFILAVVFEMLFINIDGFVIEFFKDLTLGIFCSSMVTIFFYTSAYKTEKKKLLENYWNEVNKLLSGLYKIEYLNVDYDEKILINFIYEKRNLWIKEYNKINPEISIREDLTNTNLLYKIIQKENKKILKQLSEKGKEQFLNERLEKVYEEVTNKMNRIIDQYIGYLDCSMENLNFMLGDMEFFSGGKKYKEAHELFQDLYELRIKIQEASKHFRYNKNGDGNKGVILSDIFELQKNIFRVVEKNSKSKSSKLIYNEFNDKMIKKLEDFRAKVIYNIEPEYNEEIPILEILNIKKGEI